MVCNHLRELYQLCQTNQLRLGGSDLIRIVCKQCGETDTCPSMLVEEYDVREPGNSMSAKTSDVPTDTAKAPESDQ